jgi:glutamine synthetase
LPGFEFAGNLMLLPDPASFHTLPWAPHTGALRAQAWYGDGRPVPFDTRRVLQRALRTLGEAGYGLRCGLEVEFHVYRITDPRLDPMGAAWPHEPPAVQMLHPGYHLLSEEWGDQAEEALHIVQATAQGLGLPLRSLEIELGPSQFEAVFDAMDALAAAATTPASCAGRLFRTSCPAAGICTTAWWNRPRAATCSPGTSLRPAARYWMPSTPCQPWGRGGWPAC